MLLVDAIEYYTLARRKRIVICNEKTKWNEQTLVIAKGGRRLLLFALWFGKMYTEYLNGSKYTFNEVCYYLWKSVCSPWASVLFSSHGKRAKLLDVVTLFRPSVPRQQHKLYTHAAQNNAAAIIVIGRDPRIYWRSSSWTGVDVLPEHDVRSKTKHDIYNFPLLNYGFFYRIVSYFVYNGRWMKFFTVKQLWSMS